MIAYANQEKDGDIFPFEITEFISEKTFEIREMVADLDKGFKPIILAGFCTNNEDQVWHIKADGRSLKFKIRKDRHGIWKDASGNIYKLSSDPVRWHLWSGHRT